MTLRTVNPFDTAHTIQLRILGWPEKFHLLKDGEANTKVSLRDLWIRRKRKEEVSDSKEENGGSHAFFRDFVSHLPNFVLLY